MNQDEFYIAELIHAQLNGSIDEVQRAVLEAWLRASPEHREFYERFSNESYFKEALVRFDATETQAIWMKTQGLLHRESASIVIKGNYRKRLRVAIAASIIFMLGISLWYFKPFRNWNVPGQYLADIVEQQDIAPGNTGATLTLANGKKIDLSAVGIGTLANESGVRISKDSNGQLVYTIAASNTDSAAINVLETSRGEQVQVQLPDGTSVWLNAASVLRYPASFTSRDNRSVRLSGEAYFEVAKDKTRPFTVKTARQMVEVLGTHFNIRSYSDDAFAQTTLLEGRVRINQHFILEPGQQSTVTDADPIRIREVDTQEAIDWKNGKFICENEGLPALLARIARWYDVQFVYRPEEISQEKFTGTLSRTDRISVLLRRIELTGEVQFKIDGRKIYVLK